MKIAIEEATREKDAAELVKAVVEEEAEKVKYQQESISEIQSAAQAELDKVLPELESAQ